jgi:hypothetical protein
MFLLVLRTVMLVERQSTNNNTTIIYSICANVPFSSATSLGVASMLLLSLSTGSFFGRHPVSVLYKRQ